MISSLWYDTCKLTKLETITQLTARSIQHNINLHHMKLKSCLYKTLKAGQELLNKFRELIGNDWAIAYRQSGKTFKKFQKDLLIKFHPDKHNGSTEASEISKTITGWNEPTRYDNLNKDVAWYSQCRDYARAVLTKEDFLKFHKCAMETLRRRTCNRDAQWVEENRYEIYVIQYCSVSFGGDIYRGQDFTYVAPYTEEYEDGTVSTEEEFDFAEMVMQWRNSPEHKAKREAGQRAYRKSRAYKQYNKRSSNTKKGIEQDLTRFARLTKKEQRKLVEQYGDIFYTNYADVPFKGLRRGDVDEIAARRHFESLEPLLNQPSEEDDFGFVDAVFNELFKNQTPVDLPW